MLVEIRFLFDTLKTFEAEYIPRVFAQTSVYYLCTKCVERSAGLWNCRLSLAVVSEPSTRETAWISSSSNGHSYVVEPALHVSRIREKINTSLNSVLESKEEIWKGVWLHCYLKDGSFGRASLPARLGYYRLGEFEIAAFCVQRTTKIVNGNFWHVSLFLWRGGIDCCVYAYWRAVNSAVVPSLLVLRINILQIVIHPRLLHAPSHLTLVSVVSFPVNVKKT